jgi:hypothetical protein
MTDQGGEEYLTGLSAGGSVINLISAPVRLCLHGDLRKLEESQGETLTAPINVANHSFGRDDILGMY